MTGETVKRNFQGERQCHLAECRTADAVFLSHWKYMERKSIDTLC